MSLPIFSFSSSDNETSSAIFTSSRYRRHSSANCEGPWLSHEHRREHAAGIPNTREVRIWEQVTMDFVLPRTSSWPQLGGPSSYLLEYSSPLSEAPRASAPKRVQNLPNAHLSVVSGRKMFTFMADMLEKEEDHGRRKRRSRAASTSSSVPESITPSLTPSCSTDSNWSHPSPRTPWTPQLYPSSPALQPGHDHSHSYVDRRCPTPHIRQGKGDDESEGGGSESFADFEYPPLLELKQPPRSRQPSANSLLGSGTATPSVTSDSSTPHCTPQPPRIFASPSTSYSHPRLHPHRLPRPCSLSELMVKLSSAPDNRKAPPSLMLPLSKPAWSDRTPRGV
jgi:hypothetical protein